MKTVSNRLIAALVTGTIFGIGLAVSQMIDPAKVINFLDLAGTWDPSLAFVMGGALAVNFIATRWILKRPTPAFDEVFRVPTKTELDKKLIIGSGLFGIGWAIAGYCPGPALTSLSFANADILILVAAYIAGTAIGKFIDSRGNKTPESADAACVS